MTIHHAIWTVGHPPVSLARAKLPSEKTLEEMIVAAPEILSDSWMLIGRQAKTSHGGIIDLLAIAPDGTLVLIELKRDKTPWTVIAQALDYATWVESLEPQDIAAIYSRFSGGRSLSDDFSARFGGMLNEETLNRAHEIVVVAAELDASSERIVSYLADRGIAINVLCFQVFTFGGQQLLSRVWLKDHVDPPLEKKSETGGGPEPWNGEFYASFGVGPSRSWEEAMRYGFISAGGASWYSKTLGLLKAGDRIWVKSPDHGFVGVGIVTGTAVSASDFQLLNEMGERVPALDILKEGDYHRAFADDPDRSEWFVPVDWLTTVPLHQAVREIGLFGNQNTVCRPTTPKWRTTVEYLKTRFAVVDE